MNNSDSGEEVEQGKSFLKERSLTALWNVVANYADAETMCEQIHGWWNSVTLKGKKTVVIIVMHRMVVSNTKGTNTSKD